VMGADWLRGDEEYGALVRALRRKRGFGLFFVQASPAKGADILAGLREEFSKKRIAVVELDPTSEDLFRPVELAWEGRPEIVWIEGLEQSLLGYEDLKLLAGQEQDLIHYSRKDLPPLLRGLNLSRERFAKQFSCSIVIVIPLFIVRYFLRRASDFFDWKSGFFDFVADSSEQASKDISASIEIENYRSLEPEIRSQRILEIKSIIESGNGNKDEKSSLYRELGRLFRAEGNHKAALFNYKKAIGIDSYDYQSWHESGIVFANLGQHEEAFFRYERSLRIHPSNHKAWTGLGNACFALGRYEEAIRHYDKSISIQPDDCQAFTYKGHSLRNLDLLRRAIFSYDQALKLNPDDYYLWNSRGELWGELGRDLDAIDSYNKAIYLNQEYYYAWRNRGDSLYKMGRFRQASIDYKRALSIKGDDSFLLKKIEESLIKVEDTVIAANPNDHLAWSSRGFRLNNLGRYDEAIASYDKAIEFKPNDPKAWNNRGFSLNNLGRYDEAIASYDKAIEFKSNYNLAIYNKACTYALQNKLSPALGNLKQAIELNPEQCRTLAQTDSDFDSIRNNEQFQALINGT
jgi:tetratricopeptide (TPR) repeat protein